MVGVEEDVAVGQRVVEVRVMKDQSAAADDDEVDPGQRERGQQRSVCFDQW
ncbi:MAG: hypothetical protein ACI8S6_001558 [Myxococcota bacterium]